MQIIRGISLASLFMLISAGSLAHAQLPGERESATSRRQGVLVMAHGGLPEWDAGVLEILSPLQQRYTLETALGMADAVSLQDAVSRLEQRGATDIVVVRLFISGESWFERTEQILGMRPGAPQRPHDDAAHGHGDGHSQHSTHTGNQHSHQQSDAPSHSMEFWVIDSTSRFLMSTEGLADAAEMVQVLRDRVLHLSETPSREDVLILAHGPEDDAENARWLEAIDERAAVLRDEGFHSVRVATLREDWPDKREQAEQDIRTFVAESAAAGRTAIVVPYRVHGFGPYSRVLDGLDYVADGRGLVPHPAVTDWIERQIKELHTALGQQHSALH